MGGKATKLWVYVTNQWRIQTFRQGVGGGGGRLKKIFFRSFGPTREGERENFLSLLRVSPFLAWGDFHARSRFARSTIAEEKWGN